MTTVIGALAFAGGLIVLGKYGLDRLGSGLARAAKGVEFENPSLWWPVGGAAAAVVGAWLLF